MTVDKILHSKGYVTQIGHVLDEQKNQFCQKLSQLPSIKNIAEIGFNAGHSAECFLHHCPQLHGLVSFDINVFPYTKPMAEHFEIKFSPRFLFVEGDSLESIPRFAKHFPNQKFDLIFIDGCHVFENVVGDIFNCQLLAHPQTLLWLDDFQYTGVRKAIEFCETIGRIRVKETLQFGSAHSWVEAEYLFN